VDLVIWWQPAFAKASVGKEAREGIEPSSPESNSGIFGRYTTGLSLVISCRLLVIGFQKFEFKKAGKPRRSV